MNHLSRTFSFLLFLLSFPFITQAQVEADFYFELTSGPQKMTVPLKVDFVNASSGQDLNYTWTLDGISFSSVEEASQLILKGGKYKVCLEVQNKTTSDQQCQRLEFFEPEGDIIVVVNNE